MSFAVSQYRNNQIQTSSPAQVVVQFYDGALKFIRLGAIAIQAKDYATKGAHLSRAHAIVMELQANLDHTHAPELCSELDRLYVFVLDCITEANMSLNVEKLSHAIRVLEQLRSAWAELAEEPRLLVVGAP